MEIIENKIKGKPFIKWAGGKTQLLKQIENHLPQSFNKYIEPFVGGGALFFHLNHEQSIISDLNQELTITYNIVKNNVDELIVELHKIENTEENYYKIRALDPTILNNIERAARFIFMNKTCFNGLYRVNKKGQFNVPYGKRSGPFIDESRLRDSTEILRGTTIIYSDYKTVLDDYAESEDLVFLDPPYYPVGEYSDFKRYTKEFFYHEDQVKLRDQFVSLVEKGCHVLLTNSNHPVVMELYRDFEIVEYQTKRMINKDASKRKGVDIIVIGR